MANTDTTVKITKLPITMRVNVVVTRRVRVRLWMAKHLILLAAWLLDVPIETTFTEQVDE